MRFTIPVDVILHTMIRIGISKYSLHFRKPAGTSRGILYSKPSWFVIMKDTLEPEKVGYGECSIIPGLSYDDRSGLEKELSRLSGCTWPDIGSLQEWLSGPVLHEWPSIRFGLETALTDLVNPGQGILFPGAFTSAKMRLPINGLIWMGNKSYMMDQLNQKLEEGWNCIKIKIGAIDFNDELALIRHIRHRFTPEELTLRVDANGAFPAGEARVFLDRLEPFGIHSIEQPIAAGQQEEMAKLCRSTPIPIALDEELIGLRTQNEKRSMLEVIRPQYIVLKPSLTGGLASSEEWIEAASSIGAGYWITSALESNIGLNAIAQWTAKLSVQGHQGLGTGSLYTNNIPSPLRVTPGFLQFDPNESWDYSKIHGA
jgi:o-succinylbenzoate synthase